MMIPKHQPLRSRKLREAARGQQCTVRLPSVCSGDPDTVVLAHAPAGHRGMSTKTDDSHAAFACDACHAVLDGRVKARVSREEQLECWLRGINETHAIWRDMGLISIKGAA